MILKETDVEAAVMMILGELGYAMQGSATIAPDGSSSEHAVCEPVA